MAEKTEGSKSPRNMTVTPTEKPRPKAKPAKGVTGPRVVAPGDGGKKGKG